MDTKKILGDYVSDLLGVEKHCLEAVERQTGDEKFTRYPEAHHLLQKMEGTLRTQTESLDRAFSILGEQQGSIARQAEAYATKAVASAAGAIAGMYGKLRPEDPVSRSLRDCYTTLNLIAISCTMLHTTALALREQGVADLALKNLNELTPIIVELSRVIPEVVTKELSEEGKVIDPSVWREAIESSQRAWSPKVTGTYH